MIHLVIMRGLPGSGKTTHAKILENQGFVRVSRDDLRLRLFGRPRLLRRPEEAAVAREEWRLVREAVAAGRNVVVDAMHIKADWMAYWQQRATSLGATFEFVELRTPLATCIAQDAARRAAGQRSVGAKSIAQLAQRYGW